MASKFVDYFECALVSTDDKVPTFWSAGAGQGATARWTPLYLAHDRTRFNNIWLLSVKEALRGHGISITLGDIDPLVYWKREEFLSRGLRKKVHTILVYVPHAQMASNAAFSPLPRDALAADRHPQARSLCEHVDKVGGGSGPRRRNVLFLHIPKTAGLLVSNHLFNMMNIYNVPLRALAADVGGFDNTGMVSFGHCSAEKVLESGAILHEDFFHSADRPAFVFGFVRNPWDRFVSLFQYLEIGKNSGLSFKEFVRLMHASWSEARAQGSERFSSIVPDLSTESVRFFDVPSDHPLFGIHGSQFHQQLAWLSLVRGGSPGAAEGADGAQRPLRIDPEHCFVGRFENLKADMGEIFRRIGIDGCSDALSLIDNKKVNASRHDHYSTYYDDETREQVAAMYAGDIAEFSYAFEVQAPRQQARPIDAPLSAPRGGGRGGRPGGDSYGGPSRGWNDRNRWNRDDRRGGGGGGGGGGGSDGYRGRYSSGGGGGGGGFKRHRGQPW